MRSKLKSPFFWLVALAAIGFAVLLYASRSLLHDTWEVIQTANLTLVLLLPLIQIVNYFFIGGYYRTMFGLFETKIAWTRSWGVVASLNFVNQILPSGGLSGITYLAYGFRTNLAIGKTTMIQTGRYLFSFASYVVIAPFALALLLLEEDGGSVGSILEKIQGNTYAIATIVVFLILIGFMITFVRSPSAAQRLVERVRRVLNGIVGIFTNKEIVPKKVTSGLVDEFHQGLNFFKDQKSRVLSPFGFMILSVTMELSIVYVALMAVGAEVTFAAAFASFLAANIVGVISVIPGDVGVHEAVMTTMLVAFGVDAPQALSAVLLYRVFNKVIFLPVGFYFYTLLLKPAKPQAS